MSANIIAHHLSEDSYRAKTFSVIEERYGIPAHLAAKMVQECVDAGRTLGMSPRECAQAIARRVPWEVIP